MKANSKKTSTHLEKNPGHSISITATNRAGFTLVELLVVITIVAALAAISFAGYNRFKRSANMAVAISNVRQIGTQWQLFSTDKNGMILHSSETAVDDRTDDGLINEADALDWTVHLAAMMKSLPSDTDDEELEKSGRDIEIFSDPLLINAANGNYDPDTEWSTYSYNGFIGEISGNPGSNQTRRMAQVADPTRLILFTAQTPNEEGGFHRDLDMNQNKVAFEIYGGKVPVAFADGHVETRSESDYPSSQNIDDNDLLETYWEGK